MEAHPLDEVHLDYTCTATKEAREDIFKATKTKDHQSQLKTTCSATEAVTIGTRSNYIGHKQPVFVRHSKSHKLLNFLVLFLSTRLLVDIWVIF